ncbi:hypothetical protein BDN67DRAFT_42229 [Paxillus ammoniavirescens]|nr:hypothetical protein BDN67DRAFT_42229 [Paxillus ammoniavirescens]
MYAQRAWGSTRLITCSFLWMFHSQPQRNIFFCLTVAISHSSHAGDVPHQTNYRDHIYFLNMTLQRCSGISQWSHAASSVQDKHRIDKILLMTLGLAVFLSPGCLDFPSGDL